MRVGSGSALGCNLKCLEPYCRGGIAFPCGKCSPCLYNRRGVWSHRIMLEASCHAENSFVTLTYRDEDLPSDGSLQPDQCTGFLKRLRSRGHTFRYYLVGEYGSQSGRAHYHAAIFGKGPCNNQFCVDVEKAWGLGFTSVYPLENKSAAYVAGYVLKKIGSVSPPNRAPPFQKMSLKPGLGANAPVLKEAVNVYKNYLEEFPDVLPYLKYGQYKRPLGRYLTDRIREEVMGDGYLSPRAKEYRANKRLERLRKSLQDVYTVAGVLAFQEGVSVSSVVKRAIHQENLQPALNQAARGVRRETL